MILTHEEFHRNVTQNYTGEEKAKALNKFFQFASKTLQSKTSLNEEKILDLWILWITNPNLLELEIINSPTKREESLVRQALDMFKGITGLREIKQSSQRAIGEGLFHTSQVEVSHMTLFNGSSYDNMDSLLSEYKSFCHKDSDTYMWLLNIGFTKEEIPDLFFLSPRDIYKDISGKLDENSEEISPTALCECPPYLLGGAIQFVWSKLVKNYGSVILAEPIGADKNLIKVTISFGMGTFLGQGQQNIERMKNLVCKNITVTSLDPEES